MKEKLELFIKNNYYEEPIHFKKAKMNIYEHCSCEAVFEDIKGNDVDNYINDNKDGNLFQKLLFNYIDSKGLKDSDVYNKVGIDRRLFSKIRSNDNYHPSKETVILLCIALELNEKETEELLSSASYSLPKNNVFDLIIRFCLIEKIYDISTINDLLYDHGCKLIGAY